LRPDAPTSPDRLFCHVYGRGRSADQFIPGWPYSFVAALETGRTSWTAVLDAIRLGPADDATAVTAHQLRSVVERLAEAEQWKPGDPDILIVMDTGYDVTRLAYVLSDLPVELVGRLRSDRVMLRDAGPRRSTPRGGQPRKHGGVLTFAKPDTWHTPDQTITTVTTRYGTAEALAWDRMHPRLQARGPWLDHCGELPLIHGTLIRLKVEHLPGDRDPKPVWLWSSHTGMTDADVDLRWQAFLRRFDLEQYLPPVQTDPRLDRPEGSRPTHRRPVDLADHRRPHPAPSRPSPRRGPPPPLGTTCRTSPAHTCTRPPGVPAPPREDAPPGSGAETLEARPRTPTGSKNRRPAPHHEPGKTVKRVATLTEHVRSKQQQG